MEHQFEESRLGRTMARLRKARMLVAEVARPTPLGSPLVIERVGGRLSSETLRDRIEKIKEQWQKDLSKLSLGRSHYRRRSPSLPPRRANCPTASRAAVWAAARTAIIADVHLGKADCLAVHSAPIPAGLIESQLAAIDRLLDTHSIERLLVVGDLLHAGIGLTPLVLKMVADWRQRRPLPLLVVPGNHDRAR